MGGTLQEPRVAGPSRLVDRRPLADCRPARHEACVDEVPVGGRAVTRVTLGRGWRRSIHGGEGRWSWRLCTEPHAGVVVAGTSRITTVDGTEVVVRPGDLFDVAGHHDWVVEGDEPVVVLAVGGRTPACPAAVVVAP